MPIRARTAIDTPVGQLSVTCSALGVACVRFETPAGRAGVAGQDRTAARDVAPKRDAAAERVLAASEETVAQQAHVAQQAAAVRLATDAGAQLAGYFAGRRRSFELPLDWGAVSRLQRQVLGVLFDSVGFGETVTYGALARLAGSRDGQAPLPAPAIGQLMGSNPYPLIVPCHRVVAADGLGGYSGGTGIEIKRWLLIFEGAEPPTLDWVPAGPVP
jgi:methylated-DNA-[protein]-cysteine S-methyltransferase